MTFKGHFQPRVFYDSKDVDLCTTSVDLLLQVEKELVLLKKRFNR